MRLWGSVTSITLALDAEIHAALRQAAEDDVNALGAKGLAAWGLALPVWMKASWFKKQGYQKADRMGIQTLAWKPFSEWSKNRKKQVRL